MEEKSHLSVEARLRKAERQNNRLRALGLVLMVLAGAALLMGADEPPDMVAPGATDQGAAGAGPAKGALDQDQPRLDGWEAPGMPTPEPCPPPQIINERPKHWEVKLYRKRCHLKRDFEEAEATLGHLGQEGFEVVGVVLDANGNLTWTLQRPIEQAAADDLPAQEPKTGQR